MSLWPSARIAGPLVALSIVLASVLAGCDDNQDESGARRLLARVRDDGYRNWDRAPGWPTRRSSSGPHSAAVDIFLNDVISDALTAAKPLDFWPRGSIIVKDGFDGSDLEIIAIMEKRNDGWYWAELDGAGDPAYSGHPSACIDCHRDGSDFVLAFGLP